MLSDVLNKSTCAKCKICCGFDRLDSWETPSITKEQAELLSQKGIRINSNGKCFTFDLEFDGDEIKYCPFLDFESGCTLPEDEKPFDCKIWPVRVMKKGEFYVLAVADICPTFKEEKNKLKNLIDEKLEEQIKEYIKKNPYYINEFKEGYTVIKEM